ncbi:MAG TPA: replication-associated recombination protein RarA [Clostridiales bacterium]|nr:replication-associated recombination protein RarA [Clostridiales bacterium]
MSNKEPLAYRMCPRTLDEFVGQDHIVGKGKLLYRMISADRISSIILYGPPGTGKTSLAKIIANTTKSGFEKLNAVTSGVADIKRVVNDTKSSILNPQGKTVLFIDEIHRFNKAQQDALLPFVENGTIVLIGATTENPYFEVNKALISRSTVFMLEPLKQEDIKRILSNAITDKERGLGDIDMVLDDDVLDFFSQVSGGDVRVGLNALELAALTTPPNQKGQIRVGMEIAQECVQKKALRFDKKGENHYDNISAFIKSMRGSDPDAAVFYLARALYAGESVDFLARRIMICASEDVGMANPSALQIAVAAAQAVHMIGMPEARIILSQAAIAVAVSPKSNASYVAIDKATEDIMNKDTGEVPMHLRNAPIEGMTGLGYGVGYKYAHSYEGNYVEQDYLPKQLKDTVYYEPSQNGNERKIKEYMESRKKKK